jgi:hypothetical protein
MVWLVDCESRISVRALTALAFADAIPALAQSLVKRESENFPDTPLLPDSLRS